MSASSRANWLALLIVLIGAAWILPTLDGQDVTRSQENPAAKTPPPVEEAAAPDGATDSIMNMILDSGATGVGFMGVLALFSIVAATVTLERSMNMRRSVILPPDLVEDLESLTNKKETRAEKFLELCDRFKSPLGTVLRAGVLRHGHPLLEVEKAMEDAAAREMAELRARIQPLRTVGNVAPLVGLLGTVVGMIIAFHTASQAGLGKAELLAKGIYMALLTTAGGLAIAIPALLVSAYFSGRIDKFFREMNRHLVAVEPCLTQKQTASDMDADATSRPHKKTLMSL
ncbi:MAG: MotA/TolQ/ExbB proton channel family protein [Planctomycetes bacterium]|nr:MotA/TolQ/ExbB proton channel family protein [Planctomycetota bacterium]